VEGITQGAIKPIILPTFNYFFLETNNTIGQEAFQSLKDSYIPGLAKLAFRFYLSAFPF